MLCALLYFATGNRLVDIADAHGVSKGSVRRSLKNVTQFLADEARNYIQFPLDV